MKKVLLIALMASSAAHAEFKDGNQLYSQMQKEFGSMDWFNAIGYVTGVADTLTGISVCAPAGARITAQQTYDVVKSYLEDFPQVRHHSADRIVGRALDRIWPCPKKGQAL